MKKTKLIALVCAFLSGVSGFTSGMQGESSQKNEKDLKNGASIKDEDCKNINQNLKKYGKRTLYGVGGTLGIWELLKYVGNSFLFLGGHPIAKRLGAASGGSNDINVRVPLGYSKGEDLTPSASGKLSYYTLSGKLFYNNGEDNTYFKYNWTNLGGNFECSKAEGGFESVYSSETMKKKVKNCKEIVICFGGNGANATSATPEDVKDKLVLALDLPGYGFSEQKWKNDKVLQNYAKQCLDCALWFSKTITGRDVPVTVSGWSLGGYAATYLTQFESVKKCILYAPVVLSKVNPFVRLVRPIVFGYDLDSIENLKNSNKNCKIFLTSGTLEKGDFLSLESTVLGKSVQEVTKQQPSEQGEFNDENLKATAKEVGKAILDSRSEEQKAKGLEGRLFVRLVNKSHCPFEGEDFVLGRFLSDKDDEFVEPNEN